MPQDLTIPNWYNDDTYIKDKVAECNIIRFGDAEQLPWTAESVRSFLAAANGEADYQPWMGYDNFVSNGNAENCSPNPLFNVMEYLTAKANQLNGLNDGAGYEGNNAWTAESVLKYFNDHHLSAWDHFTTSGQFENINPSNAMDLSDFLTKKAAQCNAMEFDGKSDWTPESVLEYYRDNGINAVQVAVNASDPNVVPVPASEIVIVPAGETPWGQPELTEVQLTAGQDVVSDNGMPTNFIGDVATSQSKSTFNQNDQITATNDADVLTLAMNSSFQGMNRGGFVDGIKTIDLSNETARDLNFNSKGITGAETYNIDGAVGLQNLEKTGITVNYNDVHTNSNLVIGFANGVNSGPDDSLTVGLSDVYVPSNGKDSNGNDQPDTAVSLVAQAIEDLTINSTGPHDNHIDLDGVNYMRSLAIEGDQDLHAEVQGTYLATIDGSAAKGDLDLTVQQLSNNTQLKNVTLGAGDDVLTTDSLSATATLDGGEGNDNLAINWAHNNYALNSTDIETLTLHGAGSSNIGFIGENMDGVENLVLNNVGSRQSNWQPKINLASFPNSELNVQGTSWNNVDLTIADIPEINITVGDGKRGQDKLEGVINLGDTTNLNITTDDGINGQNPTFNAEINANQVNYLGINAASGSTVKVNGQTDLSNLSNVDVAGSGDVRLGVSGALIGSDSRSVYVNTENMSGGSFTGVFENNTATKDGTASLTVQGSNLADSTIYVDGSYGDVDIRTGMGADKLVIDGGNWNQQNLNVDLGGGENTVIVRGNVNGSNFSGITGVKSIQFTDYNAETFAASGITLGTGVTSNVLPGDTTPPSQVTDDFVQDLPITPEKDATVQVGVDAPVENLGIVVNKPEGTEGPQSNPVAGEVASDGNLSVAGGTAGIQVDFASGASANPETSVVTNNSGTVTATGSAAAPNSFTGTVASVDNAAITTGTPQDTVDVAVNQDAGQKTEITNTGGAKGTNFKVNVQGAGDTTVTSSDFANVAVSASATGDTTLKAAEGTTSNVQANVAGGGTTTVDANNAPGVALNVTGGDKVVIDGAASGKTTNVTGNVGSDAADTQIVLDGNGGTFDVDGSSMSGLSNLTVQDGTANVDALETTATSFTLNTNSDVNFTDAKLNSVKQLDIATTGDKADGDVTITGNIINPDDESQAPKPRAFENVQNVTITGDQAVTIESQIGSNNVTNAVVKVGDGGITIGGAGIASKGATFTGGAGVDDIAFSVRGDSTIDLGANADTVNFLLGYGVADDIYQVTVDLGKDDNAKDTVAFYSDKNGAAVNRGGGSLITINNFEVGTDELTTISLGGEFTPGGAYTSWLSSSGDSTSASATNIKAALAAFGIQAQLADDTAAAAAVKGNLLVLGQDAYALYYTSQSTVSSAPTTVLPAASDLTEGKVDACALVKLVGVGDAIEDATAAGTVFGAQ